ncbi:hypothetical protein FQR65_LT18668 [Abscondita terminalis]|nr:hypothetical protein FQR65_LT18668 [Abscondita terminalis]
MPTRQQIQNAKSITALQALLGGNYTDQELAYRGQERRDFNMWNTTWADFCQTGVITVGGISKPSDVAQIIGMEVKSILDMPIDGDVWLEDPLNSSYPPSIAFKAAEMQDKDKAVNFLRTLRELVFLKKKNIAKWKYIAMAAEEAGLDVVKLKTDFEGSAQKLFEADLKLARDYGVRGFPTIIYNTNKSGERFRNDIRY